MRRGLFSNTLGQPGAVARLAISSRDVPRLRGHDVEVWRAPLDEADDEAMVYLLHLLSSDEQDRARQFFFERDRRRFVISRGILRILLSRYASCQPAEIEFSYGPNGKPDMEVPDHPRIHFNLAHSEGVAVYAFSLAGMVGIDLERIRDLPDWEYIADTCFSEDERKRVLDAEPSARQREFFQAWTRQEARLKARGLGLGAVGPDSLRPREEAFIDGDAPLPDVGPAARLKLYPLEVENGYAASLAVCEHVRWATFLTWDSTQLSGRTGTVRRSRRTALDQKAKAGIGFL